MVVKKMRSGDNDGLSVGERQNLDQKIKALKPISLFLLAKTYRESENLKETTLMDLKEKETETERTRR
ncbi:unnamed protein product [Arabidopsis halleri]